MRGVSGRQVISPQAHGCRSQVTGATTTMKKATTTMKKSKSGSNEGKAGDSPSQLIDARIKDLSDWRGETLARVRILIKQADAEVVACRNYLHR
jgi:hypothetical protein